MEYCVLYFERIVSILSTKYLDKWSRNDFTTVNILAEPAVEFIFCVIPGVGGFLVSLCTYRSVFV